MKVLIFYTYNQGYLSGFFKEISSRLSSDGCQVFNFSFKGKKDYKEFDGAKLFIEKKSGYVDNYVQVYKIIKKVKPDVIISNFSYSNPALLFGKLLGVRKNMTWFHSLNEQMNPSFRNIFIKKLFLKLADIVIANSCITKSQLNEVYNVPQEKLEVVPFWTNILEQEQSNNVFYDTTSDLLKIGCPSRLTTHKNQKVVIQALSKLNENELNRFHLYFAGNGNNKLSLSELASKKDLTENVSFIGSLSPGEMVNFYKTMDVIVLPSLHEAFGLVLIEALALGTPVLVSSRFGALTFIDNKEALENITFNPESAESLTVKLTSYFMNNEVERSYFKDLYNDNFNKDRIYFKIKNIILKD